MPLFDSLDGSGFGSFVNSDFDSFNKPHTGLGKRILVVMGRDYTWARNDPYGSFEGVTIRVLQGQIGSSVTRSLIRAGHIRQVEVDPDEGFRVEDVHTIGGTEDQFTGDLNDYLMVLWSCPRDFPPFFEDMKTWPGILVTECPPAWVMHWSGIGLQMVPWFSQNVKDVMIALGTDGSVAYVGENPFAEFPNKTTKATFSNTLSPHPLIRNLVPIEGGVYDGRVFLATGRECQMVGGGNPFAQTAAFDPFTGLTIPQAFIGVPTASYYPGSDDSPTVVLWGNLVMSSTFNNNFQILRTSWRIRY